MSSAPQKVLVCGDVRGKYKQLFNRVIQVNRKSGPFEMVLCVGEFFGRDTDQEYNDLIYGSLELPSIPIYILGTTDSQLIKYYKSKDSDSDYESGFELVDGITYLGRKGILTTSSGLRIAYLSGKESADKTSDDKTCFSVKDYESLLMSYQSSSSIIDIMITNQWPKHVFNYTEGFNKEWEVKSQEVGSLLIAKLCLLLRPRYQFAGGFNCFYERHPFRNHRVLAETARHVTRFIALADVANAAKDKWLYAFGISPAKEMDNSELIKQPMDTTENPFIDLPEDRNRQQSNVSADVSNQFFYDMSQPRDGDNQRNRNFDRRRRHPNDDSRPKRPRQQIDPSQCWFCLASPHVEKHLIISIGDHSYLAMAKGGLTDDHLLILPIDHMRATIEIENQDLLTELSKFKTALNQYFNSKDQTVVFFERNFKSSHLQIQVVPIPRDRSHNLKSTLLELTEERNLKLKELTEDLQLKDVLNAGIPYFYIEGHDFKLFTPIKTNEQFFPLQLGRELLAQPSALDCVDRIDWKACVLSDDQAVRVANRIRKEFEPFDFTVQ